MKQHFLQDRDLSEMYEKFFAEHLNMQWNKTRSNDRGVDIYDHLDTLDVKVYRKPRFGEYEGFFIETYLPLSNNPGWFCDPKKINNGYLLVKDAYVEEVKYDKAWIITKYDLTQAIAEARRDAKELGLDDLPLKKIESGWGYILPYKYIEKYGFEVII